MNKRNTEIDRVLRHLDEADAVSDLAPHEFLMYQYPKLLRPLARLMARVIQYAAQVITIRQSHFNRHISEAVRLLTRTPVITSPEAIKNLIGREQTAERARVELREFLASDEVLEIPAVDNPEVSILLVLYNRAELTLNCLRSLLGSTFKSVEIIIVDNASTDETDLLLQRIHGSRIIRNERNEHFLAGANKAAGESTGQNLLFLNNDTQLDPYAIEAAMAALRQRPSAGAVGARLMHETGYLQEAGNIIWQNGVCFSYGRGEIPDSFPYAFRRLTDYVSGAFLLTPRKLFESVGGFDIQFSPAYCEDADYCLALWQMGKEVVYEPDALVLHLEGSSSQELHASTELMKVNLEKLAQKHKRWLAAGHLEENKENVMRAAFARYRGKKILFVEERIPHPDLGSGFPRSRSIIKKLAEDGNFVTCYPVRFPNESTASARSALGCDIEVVSGLGVAGMEGFLKRRAAVYDVIWVSRPHILQFLAGIRRAHPGWFTGVRIIYDAEAIYCLRDAEHARMMGKKMLPEIIARKVEEELKPARNCDAVSVVGAGERAWFERFGFENVQILSFEFSPLYDSPDFSARDGILFVGPVLEDVCPNADAVERLVCGIFPVVGNTLGSEAQLYLVGYQGSQRIRDLIPKHAGIHVMGQVPQVDVYLRRARVFVAPTRFSAGLPNKVLEAAASGLPVVTTSLLASQLDWQAGEELLVADSNDEIAAACVRLHEDEQLWTRLRNGARERIVRDYNSDVFAAALRRLLDSKAPA